LKGEEELPLVGSSDRKKTKLKRPSEKARLNNKQLE